ncbi:MAG: transglutaminase TgpA family protein [Halothiobacillus sp.]
MTVTRHQAQTQRPSSNRFRLDYPLGLVIGTAILAHLFHMPIWAIPLVIAGLIWRFTHEWRGWPLPPQLVLIFLALVIGLGVFLNYHSVWGRDAGTALLTLAALLKLLETRQHRDQSALLLLGFFLIVSLLLFDQSLSTALLSLILFAGLITAWIGISNPSLTAIKPRLRTAGGLMLAGLPIAIILFLLFPRPPGTLWGTQQPTAQQAKTGLSDTLTAGEFEQLAKDDTPAFRVSFVQAIIPPTQRYWRVLVMSNEINGTWHAEIPNIFDALSAPNAFPDTDSRITYTITLEPSERRWMPSLAIPIDLPPKTVLSDTASLFSRVPLTDRSRYTVTSATRYRLDPNSLPRAVRAANLTLPDDDPQLKALASQWQGLPPLEIRDQITRYFRTHGFSYTLTPGKLPHENRMDSFLFQTKKGYCEHYATAFTLLMRAAGVPARIVTGYQGGEVIGDYLLVRQADAHAWSEIWVKEQGWIRVDPTAAVAPERITTGFANAAEQDAALPASLRRDDNIARQWARLNDRVENGWNQYVLGYSGSTQTDLLSHLGLENLGTWARLGLALLITAITWMGIFFFWKKITRLSKSETPAERAWQPVAQALTRLGLPREPAETLRTYCDRAALAFPTLATEIKQTQHIFSQWLFAPQFSLRSQTLAKIKAKNLAWQLRWLYWRRKLRY